MGSRWIWFVRPWKYGIHGSGLICNLPVDKPPTIERQAGADFPLHESSQAVEQPPAQRRHAEGGPIMILLEYTSILQFVFLDSSQVVHSRESAIMFSIHGEGLTSRHFQQGKGLLSYCETSNSTNVRFQLYWRTSPLSVCTNANVAWHNSAVKLCPRFPPNISQQHRVAPS